MDKKTKYVEKLSAQVVEWDAQLDLLKFKAESAAIELQSEYSGEIAALRGRIKEAELKLQGISAASDDTWEELKAGTDNVWDEVRADLHDAILKIK